MCLRKGGSRPPGPPNWCARSQMLEREARCLSEAPPKQVTRQCLARATNTARPHRSRNRFCDWVATGTP
eukprot:2730380-Alexandrium_andersonii.AAC.1